MQTITQKFNIASPDAVKTRVSELNRRSEDIKSRLSDVLKALWNPERELAQITDLSVFDTLRENFPNFHEVIQLWEASAIGLGRLGLPFESPPILLVGDPGLGKTFFVFEAARLFGIDYHEISMVLATAGFVLAGGNIQWAEGSPGFVAKALAKSSVANPMILLDEIEKARTGSGWDPLGPFYPLLETHSAKRFRDEALEFELDTSKIIWIATANDLDRLPAPITSRMRIFHIEKPKASEMPRVIKSIYGGLRAGKPYGSILNAELEDEVVQLLVDLDQSPRDVRKSLDEATFKVIRDHRSAISSADLPIKILKKEVRYGFY